MQADKLMKKYLYKAAGNIKDIQELNVFSSLFNKKNFVKVYSRNYIQSLLPLGGWCREKNFQRYVSLWEDVQKKVFNEDNILIKRTGKRVISNIAVRGRVNDKFVVEPTASINLGHGKVVYIWHLSTQLPEEMKESVKLLSDAISYLTPGSRSLHKEEDAYIPVPGIYGRNNKCYRIKKSGRSYSLFELWETVGKNFPVKGHALRKFLKSEKIYINNLTTTQQYIGLKQLNALMTVKFSIKEFDDKKQSFLFLYWNFARDIGIADKNIQEMIYVFCLRRNYCITGKDIMQSKPVKPYKFRNETIVKMLGEKAVKAFPMKKQSKKTDADSIRKKIAELANHGLSIKEIAATLKLHISKVKRRRSEASKLGYIFPKFSRLAPTPI